jgi:hypothetical protein
VHKGYGKIIGDWKDIESDFYANDFKSNDLESECSGKQVAGYRHFSLRVQSNTPFT